MTGHRERRTDSLVLNQEEHSYLTNQDRKHRVARSFSERCRIILRYVNGLASKAVAAELVFMNTPLVSSDGAFFKIESMAF